MTLDFTFGIDPHVLGGAVAAVVACQAFRYLWRNRP